MYLIHGLYPLYLFVCFPKLKVNRSWYCERDIMGVEWRIEAINPRRYYALSNRKTGSRHPILLHLPIIMDVKGRLG